MVSQRTGTFTTPPMKHQPPTWEALLAEGHTIWAMDFCNIIDLKLFQIYIMGIIDINSRVLVWQSITIYPNRDWIIQQFKNIAIDDFSFPKYLIIDNDAIFGKWIDPIMMEYFTIKTLRTIPRSPWQNGFIERFWRTLQNELVDRIHLKDESSVRYFCNLYIEYYNEIRLHQGILGARPSNNHTNEKIKDLSSIKFEKIKHAHGLFYEFKLAS